MKAGSVSVTTATQTVYDPATDGGVSSVFVKNSASSAGNLLVNVYGLHETSEWAVLEPGDVHPYRCGLNGVGKIQVKAVSTATAIITAMAVNVKAGAG